MKRAVFFLLFGVLATGFAYANDWQDKSPHKASFVEMQDGTSLEVLDWGGQGKTLVFLAGLALNAHTFDNFAPKFTDSYRVLGVTRIAHGKSSSTATDYSTARLARDVVTVLDEFDVDQAIFVGHSFAGSELTYLGKHYPQRVEGLIYIDAVQALEYYDQIQAHCPNIDQEIMDSFQHQDSFYNTQRIKTRTGEYVPFANVEAFDPMLEAREAPDYTGINAPAISINHIPEETDDILLGVSVATQECREALNKMMYLGVAQFVREKSNADVAAIQNSQHMIHMVTPDKLTEIMNNWLHRTFSTQ